jgi:hypothetical protein
VVQHTEPSHPVYLPIACPCSFKPYPHLLHNELDKARHEQPFWPRAKEVTGWM